MECSGIIARVIQHEYDHLQGILFTDKLSYKERKNLRRIKLNINWRYEVKYKMSFFKKKIRLFQSFLSFALQNSIFFLLIQF